MRYFILFIMVIMISMVAFGQTSLQFNKAFQIYYKSGFIAGTANDTTTWISLAKTTSSNTSVGTDFCVFGRANDSAVVRVMYRLGNSLDTDTRTSWTELDTLILDTGGGNSDSTALVGEVAFSTLFGYDQVQFYVDYLTGSAVGSATDGTANIIRFYLYVAKNEDNRIP